MIPPWEPKSGFLRWFRIKGWRETRSLRANTLWRNEFLLPNGPLNQKGAGTDKGKTKVVS